MSKQAVVSMIVGMVLGAAGVWELTARAQMQAPGFRPFASKNVFMATKQKDFLTLESPEIRIIGNRAFVVGQQAQGFSPNPQEWVAGGPINWLSLDEVVQFIEMPAAVEKKNANDAEAKKEG